MTDQNLLRTESALHRALYARLKGEIGDDELALRIRGTCSEAEFLDALAACIREIPGQTYPVSFPSDPVNLEPGSILRNRYVIEQCIGRGGKGTVFKAVDRYRAALPPSQRYVAVKVLHRAAASRPETLEALRHELHSAKGLSHPNVVKVFELDREGELDFFTMEFLEGEPLSKLLARFHPRSMSRDHAWPIIRQIAAGLRHAHEHGIVHADLKPQNILVTNSGEVRILDFGASHGIAAPLERTGGHSTSVSLAYAACEVLEGRAPDPRDDLYALACISYELLAGAHPFQRRRATEARDLGIVPARPTGLSRRQWNTLARGLCWHRAGRSLHLDDWIKGLKAANSTRPAAPLAEVRSFEQAPPRDAENSYLRASIAATFLLIIGVAWLLFFHATPAGTLGDVTPGAPSGAAPASPTGNIALPASAPAAPAAKPESSPIALQSHRPTRFAEVRIHRPARTRGNAPVVWWTEAASAKPGVDYVNQTKADQSFPAGRDSTSVFVKLLPRLPGDSPGVFYVAVAESGDKDPRHVTHTAVHLPGEAL